MRSKCRLGAPSIGCSLVFVAMLVAFAPLASADKPSLRSTWPLVNADISNSNFMALAGARELVPKWQALQVRPAGGTAVLGPEGNIYTTTMDAGPCHLYAFDNDGNLLWCSEEVRTALTTPAVSPEGAVFVTDGTEVFRFEPDGTLTWRVAATAPGFTTLTREGFPLTIGNLGFVTVYDPATGDTIAQLLLPAGVIPRPDPLPQALTLFRIGAPFVGFDPDLDFIDYFIDAFFDFDVVVGNNIPAVHPKTGRIFIQVSANPSVTEGIFYGIDFTAPDYGAPGELAIACSAPIGLASASSPAISEDGKRIYAGNSDGFVYAYAPDDCGVRWTLDLGAASLATPSVGLDGRAFMLVSGNITAFQDNVADAQILWKTDIDSLADELGFSSGVFNSGIELAANYLYGAASFFTPLPDGTEIPVAHALLTLAPDTGEIVAIADLGEESDGPPSLSADGMVYVPARALRKAILIGAGIPTPPLPSAQTGYFAFEPASFEELTLDGLQTAEDFGARTEAALDRGDLDAAAMQFDRTQQQFLAVRQNFRTARDRGELSEEEADGLEEQIEDLDEEIEELEERLEELAEDQDDDHD